MSTFRAVVVQKEEGGQSVSVRDLTDADLMDGDVTVRVTHSTLNYKDGLALTGKAPVVRRFPMIPGIDFAGIVETSSHPDFREGDKVILNGWGAGETHLGGFAQKSRVKGDWLIPLPESLGPDLAMAIGTAGYTAMLAVMALEWHGLKPTSGPALVTEAAGGVGSVAVTLLSGEGWTVIGSTGRTDETAYLKELGASEIIPRSDLSGSPKPLAKERWSAAIDSVGSTTLANALSMTRYGGAVAACGLAGGLDLPTAVAPFILRGVSLLGIDSVMASKKLCLEAWQRLASKLERSKLATMIQTIRLEDVIGVGSRILDGKVRGRVVVEVS